MQFKVREWFDEHSNVMFSALRCYTALFLYLWLCSGTSGLRKVVVPSVYKEWVIEGPPAWATDLAMQKKHNYSVFVYQKLNPNAPNYFPYNRGTETGVYLKYIVDHYEDFPDVAIFVHAHPHDHQPNWLNMVQCISPKAEYYNINYGKSTWFTRDPAFWALTPLTIEQCWRDVLQAAWDLQDDVAEFHRRLPPTEDIVIVAMQDTCHIGEPDYENLFHFNHTAQRVKCGPEQPYYAIYKEAPDHWPGKAVQGGAGEHLSHVIFGQQPFLSPRPDHAVFCENFLKNCPGSPCT